jgi:septal ring factor EnvC (AmiA/AmiB activator)
MGCWFSAPDSQQKLRALADRLTCTEENVRDTNRELYAVQTQVKRFTQLTQEAKQAVDDISILTRQLGESRLDGYQQECWSHLVEAVQQVVQILNPPTSVSRTHSAPPSVLLHALPLRKASPLRKICPTVDALDESRD